MSLRVWLPLDGDLRNLGVSNAVIINHSAAKNASGKIGSCYTFNGSNQYLYSNYNFYNTQYSVCAWIYSTSASSTQTIVCDRTTTGYGFSIFLVGGKIRIDPGGSNKQWTTNYTYPTNTWFHLSVTYNGTKVSYYINGEFKQEYTCALASNYWGNTTSIGASQTNGNSYSNYLNGRLNDIRIYDHCLSAAEVHELAQGLVLHYKLDDITYGIEDSSGYNRNAISNGSQPVTIIADTPRYSTSAKFIAGARIATPVAASQYLPVDAITTNIWIKSSNAANRFLSCTESGGWNFESNSGYVRVPLYISGKGYTYCNSSTTTWSSLSDNQWHMLSFTYDRQQLKIYIDGTIDTTANSSYPNINIGYRSNTPLTIGAESQTLSSPIAGTYVGNISDLRIYCTALSAQDIKQLYELGMKIDNSHNLHAFEIVENNNRISLNNKRQFKCNEVVENELTKFFKREELVEAHQIVEF